MSVKPIGASKIKTAAVVRLAVLVCATRPGQTAALEVSYAPRITHDRDTVRAIIARRKLNEEQREAADALMDQYMAAFGDFAGTPLGQAGAPRAHAGGEAYVG